MPTWYGQTPGDVVALDTPASPGATLEVSPGAQLTIYTLDGLTQITTLLNANGDPVSVVTADAKGRTIFGRPEANAGSVWGQDSTGTRWLFIPNDLAERASLGTPGASAYELAVAEGFEGTLGEWLASLEGNPGVGTPGKSAYELAVQEGFSGTLQQWLDSLQPADPVNGTNGVNGVGFMAFTVEAPIVVGTGARLYTNRTGVTRNVIAVEIIPSAAATSGTTTADVNIAGATIWTTQTRRPTLAAGAASAVGGAVQAGAINPNQTLTLDLDTVGVFPANTELRVEVHFQ